MPTDYRLIVVVRAARADAANAAARTIDPGADRAFSAPLRFTTSPITQTDVFMGSWAMLAEDGPRLRQALRDAGFSNREIGLVNVGGSPNMNDDLWVFDATDPATDWTGETVRNALGLTFIESIKT
jgi:hypothetical protein